MRKHIEKWYSPSLHKDMEIVTYGHFGFPLLLFPTAAADYLEYERFWSRAAALRWRPTVRATPITLPARLSMYCASMACRLPMAPCRGANNELMVGWVDDPPTCHQNDTEQKVKLLAKVVAFIPHFGQTLLPWRRPNCGIAACRSREAIARCSRSVRQRS